MQTFDAIFADTYANHNMPVPGIPGTKKGFRQVVAATRQAFAPGALPAKLRSSATATKYRK
jgi:hypothetical protein